MAETRESSQGYGPSALVLKQMRFIHGYRRPQSKVAKEHLNAYAHTVQSHLRKVVPPNREKCLHRDVDVGCVEALRNAPDCVRQLNQTCLVSGGTPKWTAYRLTGQSEAPLLSQAHIKFLGLNLDFNIDKARLLLGYQPRIDIQSAMQSTLASTEMK